MRLSSAAAVASAALAACLGATPAAARHGAFIMPWLCLERCGDNSTQIAAQLDQFAANRSDLNAAAFEFLNLGPNSTVIVNNLTAVAAPLARMGVETWSMVSSFPYPPDFLYWMRDVFAEPQPFIDAAISIAKAQGLTGFNIDWEPSSGAGDPVPTAQDAADYAEFLGVLSDAMHAAGLKVSVDVAGWSPIWNFTAIGASSVDYVATMQTYVQEWPEWQAALQAAMSSIPAEKLIVGLETVHDDDGLPYTTPELQQRFAALKAAGIRKVGIWRSPIPDNWWPFLNDL